MARIKRSHPRLCNHVALSKFIAFANYEPVKEKKVNSPVHVTCRSPTPWAFQLSKKKLASMTKELREQMREQQRKQLDLAIFKADTTAQVAITCHAGRVSRRV